MGYCQPFLGAQESPQCPVANVLWLRIAVLVAQELGLHLIVR